MNSSLLRMACRHYLMGQVQVVMLAIRSSMLKVLKGGMIDY